MFFRQRRWQMFIVEWVFDSLATVHIFGAFVVAPFVQEEFGVSRAFASWVTVGYSLGTAVAVLPAAFLGNSLGRKRVLLFAVPAEGLVLVALFFAPNMLSVAVLRILGGVTNAMVTSCMMAMVQGQFTAAERGKSLGIMAVGPGTATLVGTLAAGAIADTLGWRWLFLFIAPAYLVWGTVGVAVVFRDLPGERAPRPTFGRFDYPGMLAAAAALTTLVLSIQQFRERAGLPMAALLFAVAAFLFVAFFLIESRARFPLLSLKLFRSGALAMGSSLVVLFSLVNGAVTFLFPFYMVQGLGWTGTTAGAALIAFNIGRPVITPIGGWLADRVGVTPPLVAAAVATVIGGVLAATLGATPRLPVVVLSLLLLGAGFGLFAAPNQKQVYVSVPRQLLSLAPGLNVLGGHTGRAVGISLSAAALSLAADGEALTSMFSVAMGGIVALFVVGFTATVATLGRRERVGAAD